MEELYQKMLRKAIVLISNRELIKGFKLLIKLEHLLTIKVNKKIN